MQSSTSCVYPAPTTAIYRYRHRNPTRHPAFIPAKERPAMTSITHSPDETPVRFDLLTANPVYKPFRYPWAYEAWPKYRTKVIFFGSISF